MYIMKICENCKSHHDGSYGSGRFCSIKCSRGFSTKEKRIEINSKISLKLKKPDRLKDIICCVCHNTFRGKSNRRVCSFKCLGHLGGTTKKRNTSRMGGLRDGGGKSRTMEYINHLGEKMKLNSEEIKVAEILDLLQLNWTRNWMGFKYTDLRGKDRKFYPDFYLIDFDCYVEYKGWVTEEMKHKMKDAESKNSLRLLIIYGYDKRFSDMGLNLTILEQNNVLLLKFLEEKILSPLSIEI